MEKIEIILDNYSQETKNAALVAALKSDNSTLVELALKLKPDIFAGGEELFKYAITNCKFELLKKLLMEPKIGDNQELLNQGVRIAVSLTRTEWYEVLSVLIQNGGDSSVAVEELLNLEQPSVEAIIDLLKNGAKAYFWPMHLDKHQLIAEKLFKEGLAKSVEFSNVALEQFCLTICKNNRQSVVRKLIRGRQDLIPMLVKIAITRGYTPIVRVLHQENAITSVGDDLFEAAIKGKHYFTVKYLVENEIRKLKYMDVVNAAGFGTPNLMHFLIHQIEVQGNKLTPHMLERVTDVACTFNSVENAKSLLAAGHKCDFDSLIRDSVKHGHYKMVLILMQYATKLDESSFDQAVNTALNNEQTYLAYKMREHKSKYPEKFK